MAAATGAGAWLATDPGDRPQPQGAARGAAAAYATTLRMDGFNASCSTSRDDRARLHVVPFPPCSQCGHTEHRHREGRCIVCSILRMNTPAHTYVKPPEELTP
jgi:hypothetical protein